MVSVSSVTIGSDALVQHFASHESTCSKNKHFALVFNRQTDCMHLHRMDALCSLRRPIRLVSSAHMCAIIDGATFQCQLTIADLLCFYLSAQF